MTHLAPGIYPNIEDADYHSDPAPAPSLSSTLARLILDRSPRHAWTASPRLNPEWEPVVKKTYDIGKAAHRAVLGAGGDFVAIPDEFLAKDGSAKTRLAQDFISEAREQNLTPLKLSEVRQIESMSCAVRTRLAAMRIAFDPARSETAAIAQIDGVWCRCMVDNAPADPRLPLYDLKSCEDASPEAIIRSVERYGYDVQAAHYLAVWKAATGEDRKMRFVFVEKSAPFEVAVVELYSDPGHDADWMTTANSKAAEARRIWGECIATGEWPGYPPRVQIIGARGWEQARWEKHMEDQPAPKPSAAALKAAYDAQAPERKSA